MHCPSCGQQQVSSQTKFCSRCGLPLGLIAEVVSHGGYLPQLEQLNTKPPFFNKKKGVVFGSLWFIFFTMFTTAFFGILNAPDELIAILAVTGVFGAMMIIIGSLVLLPSSKSRLPVNAGVQPAPPPGQMHPAANQGALPPTQATPADMYGTPRAGSWRDTNDLQPTSVTESTTRLLNDRER